MLTIKELIKTLYNAFNQKLKNHRGNWEQNDPTADDYIKNRPFYTDGYSIAVKKTTFNTPEDYWWCSPFVFELKEGEVYKVIYNNKEYECPTYTDPYMGCCIGNHFFTDAEGKNTGEPFFYYYYLDGEFVNYGWLIKNAGTHTVSIYKQNIKKIDKKYIDINLPNNLVTEDNLAAVAISGDYNHLLNKPSIPSDYVSYLVPQSLTTTRKTTARTNIGAVGYESQSLTAAQKAQARTNIGAGTSNFNGDYYSLTNKPTVYTAIVRYDAAQNLSENDKATARQNIDAGISDFSGDYNDLTNRPIYKDDITEILDLTTGDIYSEGTFYKQINDLQNPYLIEGTQYKVLFEGTEYFLQCKNYHHTGGGSITGLYLGNLSIPASKSNHQIGITPEDTGERFCFTQVQNGAALLLGLYSLDALEQIRLYDLSVKIKQLDEEFIPSTVPVIGSASVGQTLVVKAVDGNGKPTEWETTGVVKSINDIEPDENGNIDVNQVTNVVFINMDGELTVTSPIEEIIALFSSSRDYPGAKFEQKLYSMTNPMAPVPSYYHQRLEADVKQDYNTGEMLKNVIRIHFAPEVPDILVDRLANTVVLDPDWIAPAEREAMFASLVLTDESTNKKYRLHIVDKTLTMTEVE